MMHQVDRVLDEQVGRGRTPGLQYVHFRADSVLHRYQAGVAEVVRQITVTPSTTFNGFSVTKTFTAVAVLQLVERGLVELDRPAVAYLPDFPYGGAITIRHLLTHSAGIPNPIPLRWTHLEAEHAGFDRNAFFRQQFEKHSKVASAPNARFAYTNLGYQLLGQVIEAVTGTSFEEAVTGSILRPIGVTPDELGFALDPAFHARGYHKRWSLTYPILGFLLDRSRRWRGGKGRGSGIACTT